MAAISGIHGHTLEITVVESCKLKNMEWFSRQDPYIIIEYAGIMFRTKTCTDGGKNPSFNEKLKIDMIEGVHEIYIAVWNSNTIMSHDFIGSGRALLNKVLCSSYDDLTVPIVTTDGKYAGEVKLIMHFPHARDSVRDMSAPPLPAAPYIQPQQYPYAPPSPLHTYSYQPAQCFCQYSSPRAPPPHPYAPVYPPAAYQVPPPSYPHAAPPYNYQPQAPFGVYPCREQAGRWPYMNP